MRKWFLMLIAMMLALPMTAQFAAESRLSQSKKPIGIGVKLGAAIPHYHYLERGNMPEDLNLLPFDTLYKRRVRPIAGVQVEIPLGNNAYFAPELLWVQRGDRRLYHNIPSNDTLCYDAKVNYLDLRLPISVVIPVKGPVQPYLIGGVEASVVMPYMKIDTLFKKPLETPMVINLSGNITQGTDSVSVNKNNMSPFDFGVFGGAGVRYTMEFKRFSLVLKLEGVYSVGLHNTFSYSEMQSQTHAVNLGNGGTHYSVGYRLNRGWECAFSVLLPLRFKPGDACSSFDRAR